MMGFSTFLLVVGFACFCQNALGADDLSQEYRFSVPLAGDDYILYWTVNLPSQEISFAVNVSTTGWVGFGLSPNGQMPGSDVVIGWVDSSGKVVFHDRFAGYRSLPTIDKKQDWFLTRGQEENGRTILKFTRNFTTCDDNDLDIMADTARIIWSYHSQDPSSLEELGKLQHTKKGSGSLNLLGGLTKERVEVNSHSLIVLNENVSIPSNKDTTYWCTVHELPQEIEQQERFIYKFSPVISKPTAEYVHHLVAYLCSSLNGTHVGSSQGCSGGNNIDIDICRYSGKALAVWAVGGMDFVFPDGVGYPMGGKGKEYIVLEIHYNNPNLDSGLVDNSGLEFFYVNDEPENRAGLLALGQAAASTMIIPPKADNFVVNGLLPAQCSEKFFPEDGINIFGNFLHTHLAGHGVVVRHLRETSTCGGLEELPPIEENKRYDFNYQQINILPKIVPVLPGDILHLECSYRTTGSAYQNVTLGGESTWQEMCLTLIYYYPELEMSYCVGHQDVSKKFTSKHFDLETETALLSSIKGDRQTEVMDTFNQVEWNLQTINAFQHSVHSSAYNALCINTSTSCDNLEDPPSSAILTTREIPLYLQELTDTLKFLFNKLDYAMDGFSAVKVETHLPQVVCPYKRPTNCPISVSGSTSIYYYPHLTLLLTMLLFVIQW